MSVVRAKKHLGQHFLKDENIARKIVTSLTDHHPVKNILEIGPGMGVLTKYLIANPEINLSVIDIDKESVEFLEKEFPTLKGKIILADFLRYDISTIFDGPFALIGNFPYNISSQILFRMMENREEIPVMVGMFQKEVAERIVAGPRNKTYGILSVLMQAFYETKYLFTVNENVFNPPPRVKSAVIECTRLENSKLDCDEKLFFRVVKTAFNQRRKTLRNSLKSMIATEFPNQEKRAEELSVDDFVELTQLIEMLPNHSKK
jgi:16S rRNA (adenine1518-N6/adenine1519-N6)-dimethyltransferase